MAHFRIEKPQPHTRAVVLDRPERMNAIRARREKRRPVYED